MSIFRINKNKNYSIISNKHFKEKQMSLKAKGLLSQMLSLPDDWNYSIAGLCSINKENETAIKSTLKELQEFGYLKITKLNPNETKSGRIEYIYDIYEEPKIQKQEYKKQEYKKQEVENLEVVFLDIENPIQLNNNILNNNNKIINNKNKYPTLEEINQYIEEKQLKVDGKQFYDYFTEGNWIDAKGNKVKNWKQKLLTWNKYSTAKVEEKKKYQNYNQRQYDDLSKLYANSEV